MDSIPNLGLLTLVGSEISVEMNITAIIKALLVFVVGYLGPRVES